MATLLAPLLQKLRPWLSVAGHKPGRRLPLRAFYWLRDTYRCWRCCSPPLLTCRCLLLHYLAYWRFFFLILFIFFIQFLFVFFEILFISFLIFLVLIFILVFFL